MQWAFWRVIQHESVSLRGPAVVTFCLILR